MLLISRDVFNLVCIFFPGHHQYFRGVSKSKYKAWMVWLISFMSLLNLYIYLLFAFFIAIYWQDSTVMMDNPYYICIFILYLQSLNDPWMQSTDFNGRWVTDRFCYFSPSIWESFTPMLYWCSHVCFLDSLKFNLYCKVVSLDF